jgi:hypothetical protein
MSQKTCITSCKCTFSSNFVDKVILNNKGLIHVKLLKYLNCVKEIEDDILE